MRKEIANYDNAIVYNDHVLKCLFDIFRNRKAVAVYVSDHGEEIYDYRPRANRPPVDDSRRSDYAHYQHDTPCLMWYSDRYKKAYPDIIEKAQQANNKPYTHDLIGNMMLHLGHINTPYYRATEDILSDKYKTELRNIYTQKGVYSYEDWTSLR